MEIPEVFNWVRARAECNPAHVFRLLVETIDSDVKAINERGVRVECNHISGRKIVVSRQDGGLTVGGVVFEQTNEGLLVTQNTPSRRQLFTASLHLGPDGRCRYEINGQAQELWQVSRAALEWLFFAQDSGL